MTTLSIGEEDGFKAAPLGRPPRRVEDEAVSVRFGVSEGVAEIRFNRPDRLNAIDPTLALAFERSVDLALEDPNVRVVLLSGEGRSFMAGGDLDYFRGAPDRVAAAHDLISPMHRAIVRLAAAPLIVVAALHGAVAGGGMSLALSADLAIAADNMTLNMAYGRVAASPDCSGSWHLTRIVGLRKAMEIVLLSPTLDAASALSLGLVNRVVAADRLTDEARLLSRLIASGPSQALGHIKSLLRAAGENRLEDQMALEASGFARAAATADFAEALSAFFERRPPIFEV